MQDRIAFVSGRSGKGDIYLLDVPTKTTTRLTNGDSPYLYPEWSPDGARLAVIRGTNENHDIYLLEPGRVPPVPPKPLSTWRHDDLRPMWSPDGKRVAFYTNYNPAGDPRTWAIAAVAADGSDPTEGERLAARIVATDVVPDVERGPAWMPDSRRIVYVRDESRRSTRSTSRTSRAARAPSFAPGRSESRFACSREGLIAFRAQVDQWDQLYVAKLKHRRAPAFLKSSPPPGGVVCTCQWRGARRGRPGQRGDEALRKAPLRAGDARPRRRAPSHRCRAPGRRRNWCSA